MNILCFFAGAGADADADADAFGAGGVVSNEYRK